MCPITVALTDEMESLLVITVSPRFPLYSMLYLAESLTIFYVIKKIAMKRKKSIDVASNRSIYIILHDGEAHSSSTSVRSSKKKLPTSKKFTDIIRDL